MAMEDKSQDDVWQNYFDGEVRDSELRRINARRRANGLTELSLKISETSPVDITGLALSGGGVRSAAFSMGVLQAIDSEIGTKNIDTFSTVSGGGYIGTSASVGMDALGRARARKYPNDKGDQFPYGTSGNDKSDNPAVGYIRDHSRYLMPHGFGDLLASMTVLIRGLCANLAVVLAIILFAAGVTGFLNPDLGSLASNNLLDRLSFPGHTYVDGLGSFAFTKLLLLFGAVYHIVWAFWRSTKADGEAEFKGFGFHVSRLLIGLTALSAFFELQPFALKGLLTVYSGNAPEGLIAAWTIYLSTITPFLAPVAAAVAFASKYLGDMLKPQNGKNLRIPLVKRAISHALLLFAALVLPLIIWIVYLHFTLAADIKLKSQPAWLESIVRNLCGAENVDLIKSSKSTDILCGNYFQIINVLPSLFLVIGVLALLLSWRFLKPNTNSLHRLYRDRLSNAFLFNPAPIRKVVDTCAEVQSSDNATLEASAKADFSALREWLSSIFSALRERLPSKAKVNSRIQFEPCGATKLSEIGAAHAPLHLINTALNIQGSQYANQRGRNAEFFYFSQDYCGSLATGFVKTGTLEHEVKALDAGTAMAISGAAASSNMGSNSVWGFAPTLALLNIRLGYWMKNPRKFGPGKSKGGFLSRISPYLLKEMFSSLDVNESKIYLTDGGHIENLGLYELLRRRCKRIIVVDAEADAGMTFRSLVDAQRYARIDLGCRIDLPWREIRDASLEVNELFAKGERPSQDKAAKRPHVAIGTIDYGPNEKGVIMYVKSSLTGDENDYVLDYKSRNQSFPHETTSDQFFSEEQFEVYRALGFHAAQHAFDGTAHVTGLENLRLASGDTAPERKNNAALRLFFTRAG